MAGEDKGRKTWIGLETQGRNNLLRSSKWLRPLSWGLLSKHLSSGLQLIVYSLDIRQEDELLILIYSIPYGQT